MEVVLDSVKIDLPSAADPVQAESSINSRRIKAQARWRDPQIRAYLMQRYHSREAREKRANSTKKWWTEHPEQKALLSSRNQERWIARKMQELEQLAAGQGQDVKAMLRGLYHEQGLNMSEIGKILKVCPQNVSLLLRRTGVINPEKRFVSRVKNPVRRLIDLVRRSVDSGAILLITPNERTVLERRFLFDGDLRPSLRELRGSVVPGRSLSTEWVRQLEINGLVKLEVLDGNESRADRLTLCCQARLRNIFDGSNIRR